MTDAPFDGAANLGGGDFKYRGKITVRPRSAVLDLLLQPDRARKHAKEIHVEVFEDGYASVKEKLL
jgi:hypothetical protein